MLKVQPPRARESGEHEIDDMREGAALIEHVIVIKRSMAPGFAGIQNPLFFHDNTMMVFGDAKETVTKITEAVREIQ